MYQRILRNDVIKGFKDGFVTIIYGARRVGKTVLLDQIKQSLGNNRTISFNGDTQESINALNTNSEIKLTTLVKDHDVIFIDEAQKIPNITLAIKIIIDKFPQKKIIVTGSSSLQLVSGAKENLTGRNYSYNLYPLSTTELGQDLEKYKISGLLEDQLVFGGYPFIYHLATKEEREKYLAQIVEDYLFKDVLLLEQLYYPESFKKLAVLLAFQIGNEVSVNELSNNLGISVKTVARYLDLLEKSFVIFHLDAYSTNLRNEINKNKKYYFYDLGIRNALVEQFQPISGRVDVGHLWENFLIIERIKKMEYAGK
ncbi:MAG: ATP-binding protein, partial [Candidatus Taylorbacteria bacterium]|nr:ATP-binding protein [Candidatus Taylorbacteria bacterium]